MKKTHRWVYAGIGGLLLCIMAVSAAVSSDFRLLLQKMATELAMPYGLVFIGLLAVLVISLRQCQKRLAWISGITLLVHALSGNGYFAGCLSWSLEKEFARIQPLNGPAYDIVVVLGGGTNEGVNGPAQLSAAGGRVVMAAQLYHAGLTKSIVCTGKRRQFLSQDKLDPSEEAAIILRQLAVPQDVIIQLPGRTTREEMQLLSQTVKPESRVGLITSAWHMKCALRLAERHGIDASPLPVDFYTSVRTRISPMDMVPASHAHGFTRAVAKEYMAWLVGR